MKVWSNGTGHMTKMAAIPLYLMVKTLKNSSSLKPDGQYLRTLYTALGTRGALK